MTNIIISVVSGLVKGVHMTAKEYLSQLKLLDVKINQRKNQQEKLKDARYNFFAVNTENEKVSGGVKSSYNKSDKYMDIEKAIEKDIDEYFALEHKIIGEIHQLTNPLYVNILHKKYVEFKGLELIAVEMNYNYNYIRHMHGSALKRFDEIVLSKHTKAH